MLYPGCIINIGTCFKLYATFNLKFKKMDECLFSNLSILLTLFPSSGCQFGTPLPIPLYMSHGFRSESEDVEGNSVKEHVIVFFSAIFNVINAS